ncbi:MAG: protein kinase, partial [Anaerolineales bacterium]|nr:protein kinase [Anaerolineales bacterium]
IMDFGLARMTGGTLLTQEGMAMGTIAYMSPEQARGEEVDHRTDIWSFGVVLYEIFTGGLPFKGAQDQAVVYSILSEKPKPITDLRTEIPMSIDQVVSKTLEKNPDDRYQQIDDLLEDLRSISEGIVPEEIKARVRKAKLLKRKRAILYTGTAGLIIIMAVIALSLFTGRAEAIESIAVLPLENLTGDAGKEYFVDGITDELIGQLGQISALRVISRTSVMQYKESGKSLSEIARELKVDAVVEGSVQQVGESVRIRVQLIDALPEERNLWGQTYDRAMTDVLVMYSEMARAIADEIQVKLLPAEQTRLASAQVVNPEAYDAYLKGSYHWKKLTPAGCDTAQRYFELALENDPSYAPAYEGLAWVWAVRQQMGIIPPREAGPNSRAAALQAIALDDNSAGAHVALAVVKTWTDWDWVGAQKAWQRALELNPNDATTQAYYSHFLAIMGRADEAIPHIELALELDPFNALFHSLYAGILNYHRRYEDAVAAARTALATQPDAPVAREQLNLALTAQGMHDEKLAAQRERFAHDSELVAALERGLEEAGYEGAQRRIADVLAARYDKPGGFRARTLAELYFDAGDKDLAVDWFEKAYEEHDPNLPYLGRPFWDPLRSDPRFLDLLRKMNLPLDVKE